jgi:hypothetical protein
MKITGKDLHSIIEEYVPDFDDADLFHAGTMSVADNFRNNIIEQLKEGAEYLSIDNENGIEIWYFDLY